MTNSIDDAVARIQQLALEMSSVTIKSAPDYPIENVDPLPMVVSFASNGGFYVQNSSVLQNLPTISVEFHFSRLNLPMMQQQINAVVYEFPRRLAGDPTLAGTVETMVMTPDQQITYASRPFAWATITTHMLVFSIPIKLRVAPL